MDHRLTRFAALAVFAGATIASVGAVAPAAPRADEQDPGVARISVLSGGDDVKRADSGSRRQRPAQPRRLSDDARRRASRTATR